MNYQRLYLLSIMGIGLIFAAPSVPALLTDPSLPVVLLAIGGVGTVLSSAYGLVFVDNPAGPTDPDWRFFGAVGGFVLSAAGVAISVLA
jgi:hypothetical protein